MNDWDVLDQHLGGDTAAIDQLVRRHIHFVYSTARRLVSATEADDVVQAVFLLLTRKAAEIPRRGTLTGWLYRTTRFCCSNLRRMEARRRRHEMEAAVNAPPAPAPEYADAAWFEALDAALDRLSTSDRDAVLLHYLQQRTFEETAQVIGITPEAARKRTGRALEKLRVFFARRGYTVPTIAVVGAGLGTATRSAPAATLNASLQAAHGKAGAAIAAFAHSTGHVMAVARLKAALIPAIAALLALTAGVWGIVALRASVVPGHVPIVALPSSPRVPGLPAAPGDVFQSALPQIHLDAEPSEAEAKAALKVRLQLLSNVIAHYNVHTEYPAPAGGWSALLAATPPGGAEAAPPFSIDRPATTVYPSGTSDTAKTLSLFDGRARYERTLVKAERIVPLPPDAAEYVSQIFTVGSNPPEVARLFLDRAGNALVADILPAARLPDPDLEAALGLRLPFNGPPEHQATARMSAEMIDGMTITFPDRNNALASMTFNHAAVAWSLDRAHGYAPTGFRYGRADFPEIEMSIDNGQRSCGLLLPSAIATNFRISRPAGVASSEAPDSSAGIWRRETLTVASIQIRDGSNTEAAYAITPPPDIPAPLSARGVHLNGVEARLGGESFDAASVVGPLIAPAGSPSAAAPRGDAYWQARHGQFVKQARQGQIDLLFLGDKPIEEWPKQPAWPKYFGASHAAAFGIAADRVENLLWRVQNGELDGLAPKVVVLFIGGVDAAIDGRFAYGPEAGGPGDAFTFSSRMREDSPEAIVAGIQEIMRTIREKSPHSKILLVGLCQGAVNPGALAHVKQRAAAINGALARLDNQTTVRYLDLSPALLEPDGSADIQIAPDLATLYEETYDRWGKAMAPMLKQMW